MGHSEHDENLEKHLERASMKNVGHMIWGALIVAFGVLLALKALGLADFDIFFPGWWTLLIIIPSVIALLTERDKKSALIGLAIGAALMLACLDVISFGLIWKLIIPIILVAIGISIITRSVNKRDFVGKLEEIAAKGGEFSEHYAMFAGEKVTYAKKDFQGCKAEVVFGGMDINLEDAKITKDVVVKTSCVFGGIKLIVPDKVNVEIKSTNIFGGTNTEGIREKRGVNSEDDGALIIDEKLPTIYIDATNMFGGLDIK